MTRLVDTFEVDETELAELLRPRDDLVREHDAGDGVFELDEGPFSSYRRTVEHEPGPDGRIRVTQTTHYRLAIPVWAVVIDRFVRPQLRSRRRPPHGEMPWWSPPDRFGERAARVLSLACVLSYFAGYLGTLMSQTNTYFKDEFEATNTEISWALIGVRLGAFLALGIGLLADRQGRRSVMIISVVAGSILAVAGALAPNLVVLGSLQSIARAFSAAVAIIVTVYAIEEVPASSRAFAVSVLTMTGALGAGFAIMLLPLADIGGEGSPAWRILFLVPILFVWPSLRIGRVLPESDRFRRLELHEARGDDFAHTAPAAELSAERSEHRRRFVVLGASALLFAIFFTPGSNYLNEYLRDERAFTGGSIMAFQLLTNLPGGLGILVGGYLADSVGRRFIGSVAVVVGVGMTTLMFLSSGALIWAYSAIGSLVGAAAVPALAVYGPELFPTGSRGFANGGLNLLGVAGAIFGLLVVGALSDSWGTFGTPMALMSIGPAIVVVLILAVYPETAHKSLEELNPEDDLGPA